MESITERIENYLDHEVENFHVLMRASTDIFANNIFSTKYYTYYILKDTTIDKVLKLLNGNKDYGGAVINTINYNDIIKKVIVDGIKNKIYQETPDNTPKDLKFFQEFLYRNFKDYESYDDMRLASNQPAKLYGTFKTRFRILKYIALLKLKCRPIVDQAKTFIYKAAKTISNDLKPLCQNKFSISDT